MRSAGTAQVCHASCRHIWVRFHLSASDQLLGDYVWVRDAGYLELNLERSAGTGPLEYEMSTIWALSDFTEECAATRLVPGSHRQVHKH